MQELRPPQAQPFSGVDLRRPKGYPPAPPVAAAGTIAEGDPCPRCDSRDTKFCYYNNYNTSQPRHFCKCCRRYWTKGGTLRNVPVGGGTRKNSAAAAKRPKPSKRRRVAPPEPSATPAAEITTQTPMEAASEVTTELAVPAAEEGGFTSLMQSDLTAALGLGLSDPGGKAAADPDTFEWPLAFDLGAYWNTTGFADSDPTLFLNLP